MPPRLALCVLLLAGACHQAVGPPTSDTLVGLTLPLIPGPGLRLAVEASLQGRPAEVQFDLGAPLSVVTSGCVDEPLVSSTQVRVVDAMGDDETFPLTRVVGLTLGGRRFRAFQAGLFNHPQCIVSLGSDVLAGAALAVSPDRRLVSLLPTRSRAEWLEQLSASSDDVQLVDLTRDARHDWPLLPVRVVQAGATMTATFVLSTRERESRVFEGAARRQGLKPGLELLVGLAVPQGLTLPPELQGLEGVAYDRLELSPGYGVELGSLRLKPGEPTRGVAGVLAVDAWGRFQATIDLDAQALVLRRPRLLASGARMQCERGGALSEEACFQLSTQPQDGGVTATGTVWRPLREGARLYLDPVPPSPLACRVGLTFPPGDRGRSTQHTFPWSRLFTTMGGCARALAAATDLRLGLFEEGNLKDCPGVCAFAQDLQTGRVSCECQPGAAGQGGDAEKRFLELYRKLLEGAAKPTEVEPAEP